MVLANPQGLKTGYDPMGDKYYQEIPGASYELIGLDDAETGDPGEYTKEIDVRQPIAGDYQLFVVGTGSGVYTLEIIAWDPAGKSSKLMFSNLPIVEGETHSFAINFPKTVGGQLSGSYNGSGQRPNDVNTFLSYASPTAHTTDLPSGTSTYTIFIFYGESIIPSTFKAELEGMDVTSSFYPTSGGYEPVTLNLAAGRNTLVLSVEALLNGRTARDTDRLVLNVH